MAEVREALTLVQSFDPPGVGARDVEECLLLQLRRGSGDTAYERRLIEHHFDDLLNNRLPKVAKETGTSLDRVKEALEAIALLNPKPGALYDRNEQLRYILPDVIVEEVDGEYVVRLNDSSTPRLRISRNYMELMRAEKRGSATRDYIREKIQSAKWLIDAIEQRRNTLYKIAVQIVRIQRNFWEKGVSSLKPLMMQEVADRIGMHVSTVSRALADKWMQTPRGLFPMKYFFTGGFDAPDGSSQSNRSVKNRIQKMVDTEDKKTPLSDQEIASRLKVDGIEIARRTVAKYREKIGILSSRQRKEY
ncbi:MAG: RNA polymerase factor sigma-54 [Planctomycetes bacterium]|nr:RNA polymerase factor sigma-54 [Planctomycetota bacterium]